jgi:uncharacterized RDD family membrane protein YckC
MELTADEGLRVLKTYLKIINIFYFEIYLLFLLILSKLVAVVIKRIKAFLIDYLIILIYIICLTGVTYLTILLFHLTLMNGNPYRGELLGFTTLTLPVILYFTISEHSRYCATIGKRKTGLQVLNLNRKNAGLTALFIRNCLKFLPWEIAHFFIYRLFYEQSLRVPTTLGVIAGLTMSQLAVLLYLLFMIFNRNNRTIYELLSGTQTVS